MVKSNSEKIEVYSKVDKRGLKTAMYLFIIATLWSIISLFFGMGSWIITIIGIALLLIDIYLYKNLSDEPKLEAVLTKEYVEFYKKRGNIKFEMDKIINFANDTTSDFYHNEVFINYKDENGKKKTQIIYLRGIENTKFCMMANSLLEGKEYVEEKKAEKKESKKGIFKAGEEKNIYCVGKEKIVNANNYKALPKYIDNVYCFVDEDSNEYFLNLSELYFNDEFKKIDIKKFYKAKYSFWKDKIIIEKSDKTFDSKIIEEYESRLDVKNILNTDEKIVEEEVKIVKRFRIKFKLLGVIFFILLFLAMYIKYGEVNTNIYMPAFLNNTSMNFIVLMIFVIMIYGYSLIYTTSNKIKKIQ